AVRRQAKNYISNFYCFSVDDAFALHCANNESGKIVFSIGIKTRHLSGLATDQRASIVLAGLSQAFYDFFSDLRLELSRGQVIHEEQRRGALHRDVFETLIHQVIADGVMRLHLESDLKFGADPIDAGDKHGLDPLPLIDGEHPAKAANLADHIASKSFMREVSDAFLGLVGALDVNTGIAVGDRGILGGVVGHGAQSITVLGEAAGYPLPERKVKGVSI